MLKTNRETTITTNWLDETDPEAKYNKNKALTLAHILSLICIILLVLVLLSYIFLSPSELPFNNIIFSKKNNKYLESYKEINTLLGNTEIDEAEQELERNSQMLKEQLQAYADEAADQYPNDVDPNENTIFVSIASFRDPECDDTIDDLFKKADHPENIYIGICEQNRDASERCTTSETFKKYHSQIRSIHIPSGEAKGPTYGRFLSSIFYRGEKYLLQIDSHLVFVPHWDTKLFYMHNRCPSKKCVFSHYPPDVVWKNESSQYHTDVPIICRSFWNHDDILAFKCDVFSIDRTNDTFLPVPFTGAGFIFGPGSMVKEVPYDPNLPFLFHGEEILHSVRLWTSGYDFYTPSENVVYHHYGRPDKPKIWSEPAVGYNAQFALGKVKYFLKQDPDPQITKYAENIPKYDIDKKRYGMGTFRTVEDFWAFSGVSPFNRTTKSREKFCKLVETEKS